MELKGTKERKRGGLLTAYLVLSFIGNILGCFAYYSNQFIIKMGQPALSNAAIIISTILSIAGLVFVVGTWKLQKWGVYGLIACSIIGVIQGMILGTSLAGVAISVGFTVLLIVLTSRIWGEEKKEQDAETANDTAE